jgi:hypothetical protein
MTCIYLTYQEPRPKVCILKVLYRLLRCWQIGQLTDMCNNIFGAPSGCVPADQRDFGLGLFFMTHFYDSILKTSSPILKAHLWGSLQ